MADTESVQRDKASLKESVREAYSLAAEGGEGLPFPVGVQFAESVGYPAERLAAADRRTGEAFAGVSAVAVAAPVEAGQTVLDLGCGAGLDSAIAVEKAGAGGRVIGVDFSAAMLRRARQGVPEAVFVQADAERLPLRDASVDVALVNGIFNLNPNREALFQELRRVVRHSGRVFGAELVLAEALPEEARRGSANWFS